MNLLEATFEELLTQAELEVKLEAKQEILNELKKIIKNRIEKENKSKEILETSDHVFKIHTGDLLKKFLEVK